RGSVPPLLRVGRANARNHRCDPAAIARAAPRQRGVPPRPRNVAAAGASVRAPWPFPGERKESRYSVLLAEGRGHTHGARTLAEKSDHRPRDGGGEGSRHTAVALVR